MPAVALGQLVGLAHMGDNTAKFVPACVICLFIMTIRLRNQRSRHDRNIEDARIRHAPGYRVDGTVRRWAMFVLAKSARCAWRPWSGCYSRKGGPRAESRTVKGG